MGQPVIVTCREAAFGALGPKAGQSGAIVVKFWLQISQDEQLQRFKAREATPYKQYKITDEDWRNRHKWDEYKTAIDEMLERTSTQLAPWTLVPAEDKLYARIKVMKTLAKTLRQALKQG